MCNILINEFPKVHFSLSLRVISIPGILCLSPSKPTLPWHYIFFLTQYFPLCDQNDDVYLIYNLILIFFF